MGHGIVLANILINFLMTLLAGWLMASSTQRRTLRLIMSLVCTGGLADLSAVFWVGYPPASPGELIVNIGLVLLLGCLALQPYPAENDDQAKLKNAMEEQT